MNTPKIEYKGNFTADTTLLQNFSATKVELSRFSGTDGDIVALINTDANWDNNFLVMRIPVTHQTSGELDVSLEQDPNTIKVHFNRMIDGEYRRDFANSGKIRFEYDQQRDTISGTGYFNVTTQDKNHEHPNESYAFENIVFSIKPAN
ncbi:hypothetical protein [Pseudomonas rhodesiae]|uniref:hypothetical protein n=1 Tax=Pseudomonas rhodesiae TaxID=76760 RepID=UPI001BCF6350|nr:hypothetical protein [Pseudomonas rhodesiae]QVN03844.1 hypothetical protein JYG38_10430 [Pseudomonas rhodesiae]WLG41746.1 hypothetical protein PSH93_11520 [Pseudomonas rhodesiae]